MRANTPCAPGRADGAPSKKAVVSWKSSKAARTRTRSSSLRHRHCGRAPRSPDRLPFPVSLSRLHLPVGGGPFFTRGLVFTGLRPFIKVFTTRGLYPRNPPVFIAELAPNVPFSPQSLFLYTPCTGKRRQKRGQKGPYCELLAGGSGYSLTE